RPGRLDLLLEIPLPDLAGRRKIFEIGLRGKPVAKDVRPEELAALTDETFTGADIQAVCTRAALEALREAVAKTGVGNPDKRPKALITRTHFEHALESIRGNGPTAP
ncbi:MAG: AAA family ATPase, partial [Phycisphaerae bacterium]